MGHMKVSRYMMTSICGSKTNQPYFHMIILVPFNIYNPMISDLNVWINPYN